jgi:hypothetical protein
MYACMQACMYLCMYLGMYSLYEGGCAYRVTNKRKLSDDFVRFLYMLANSASTNSYLSQPSSRDSASPSPDAFDAKVGSLISVTVTVTVTVS